MSEEEFLTNIARKREKAIKRSDKMYEKQFLNIRPRPNFLLLLLIALVVISLIVCIWHVTEELLSEEETPTTIVNEHYNLVNNVTEYTIDGDQQMVCIQDLSTDEIVCYKED